MQRCRRDHVNAAASEFMRWCVRPRFLHACRVSEAASNEKRRVSKANAKALGAGDWEIPLVPKRCEDAPHSKALRAKCGVAIGRSVLSQSSALIKYSATAFLPPAWA